MNEKTLKIINVVLNIALIYVILSWFRLFLAISGLWMFLW